MRKNMINSSMKSILLAGILIATVATTACAGVKARDTEDHRGGNQRSIRTDRGYESGSSEAGGRHGVR